MPTWEGNHISEVLDKLAANGIDSLEDMINILEQSYDGIILSDHQGRIFFANGKAIARLSNMPSSGKLIGKTSSELVNEGVILEETKTKTKMPYLDN